VQHVKQLRDARVAAKPSQSGDLDCNVSKRRHTGDRLLVYPLHSDFLTGRLVDRHGHRGKRALPELLAIFQVCACGLALRWRQDPSGVDRSDVFPQHGSQLPLSNIQLVLKPTFTSFGRSMILSERPLRLGHAVCDVPDRP
jgi:hypothetical protein